MALNNLSKYAQAFEEGGHNISLFYKTSVPTNSSTERWQDLSMGGGTPKYNAYVGGQLEATPLIGVGNAGIYVGGTPEGKTKYLHKITAVTTATNSPPIHLLLCDYLLFYPLISGDDTEIQLFDNSQVIPRYSDGRGVQVMFIVTTPMTNSVPVTVGYTNQDGVDKQTTFTLVGATNIGSLATSATSTQTNSSPFMFLVGGDSGVQKLNSITFSSSAGGFLAAVLVKPLAQLTLLELGVPNETCPAQQMAKMVEIKNGAYLNFIQLLGGNNAPTGINGIVETINV